MKLYRYSILQTTAATFTIDKNMIARFRMIQTASSLIQLSNVTRF